MSRRSIFVLAVAGAVLLLGVGGALGEEGQEPEPDCHGPMYYKMKADAEKRVIHQGYKEDVRKFTFDMQTILTQQHALHRDKLLAEQVAQYEKCINARKVASPLCSAYGKRQLELCLYLPQGLDSIICRYLLGSDIGREEAFKGLTEELDQRFKSDHDTVGMLLDAAGGKAMNCGMFEGELRDVCVKASRQVEAGALDEASRGEDKLIAAWVLAVRHRNADYCAGMLNEVHREVCEAFLSKDLSHCRIRRPLLDRVDRDWSCRLPLLTTRLQAAGKGAEVILEVGSSYGGVGECDVEIQVEYGGTLNRRVIGRVSLSQNSMLEVRALLSGEVFKRAELKCDWRHPEAEGLLKRD